MIVTDLNVTLDSLLVLSIVQHEVVVEAREALLAMRHKTGEDRVRLVDFAKQVPHVQLLLYLALAHVQPAHVL